MAGQEEITKDSILELNYSFGTPNNDEGLSSREITSVNNVLKELAEENIGREKKFVVFSIAGWVDGEKVELMNREKTGLLDK